MKSTKLKKKLKPSDIVFPSTFASQSKSASQFIRRLSQKKFQNQYHQFIERSQSKEGDKKKFTRSLSVNHQYQNQRRYKSKGQYDDKKIQSFEKRLKRGNSSIEISKIFYDNLQKRLNNQCQKILKQQNPIKKVSSYELQKISNNLLFIKHRPVRSINSLSSYQKFQKKGDNSEKQLIVSELSIIQKMITHRECDQIQQKQYNNEKQKESFVDIQFSEKTVSEIQKQVNKEKSIIADYGNSNTSQNSVKKSQVCSSLIDSIANETIYFFSSKFSIKYTTYFKITSLKIYAVEQKHFEMEIYFKVYNQILFKKMVFRPTQQRKVQDHRNRKGYFKKLQVMRQKLKQRVVAYFKIEYTQQIVMQFYQDLIIFLENFLVLEQSYRGLFFIDSEQNALQLKNQQKIFEILKVNKYFYFIMKLNSTFYLVKAVYSHKQIKFTFMYDFKTHNIGDQLFFTYSTYHKLNYDKVQSKASKPFLKAIREFTEMVASEWKWQQTTKKQLRQKESSAKILQLSAVTIQKWDSEQSRKIKNINRSYEVGKIQNFFKFHDQFDFGFFENSHHIFENDQYNYTLDEIDRFVPVYIYPHTYLFLQLTQVQKQMLVLPHLPEKMHRSRAKDCINRFFHRQIVKKDKKNHEYFIICTKNKQIRIKQIENFLNIYLCEMKNLRSHKMVIPIQSFPSSTNSEDKTLDLTKARQEIQKILNQYVVEKAFLYSKLCRLKEQKSFVIYYKSLQKFEGHFAFVTLYGLPLHQIIEFKMHVFKIGREFVIRLDSMTWLGQINIKDLIESLIETIKNIYFKKLIQEQVRKSKKRRMQSLQNFLKKHGKSYVNQVRHKKKTDDHSKRRMMKLATLRQHNINTLVYQNIVKDDFISESGEEYLITIRYLPSDQFKEQTEWRNENIEICIYKERNLNYFKHVASIQELVYSISQGKTSIQRIDFRQVHQFFKGLKVSIKQIIQTSNHNMNFMIRRLRMLLIYNYQPISNKLQPFKYKLMNNILYETKKKVKNEQEEEQSQFSIEDEIQKKSSVNLNTNLIFKTAIATQYKQQLPSNFVFVCKRPQTHSYKVYIDQSYIIQLVDIFRSNDDYRILKEYNVFSREIWITNRHNDVKSILCQWQVDFLRVLDFREYNPKLFKRLLKCLRPSL